MMDKCADCGEPGYIKKVINGQVVVFCKQCVDIELIGKLVKERGPKPNEAGMVEMHLARGRIQQRLLTCFGLMDDCWLSDTEHLTHSEREYFDDLMNRVETMIAKFEFGKPKGRDTQSNENKADTTGA